MQRKSNPLDSAWRASRGADPLEAAFGIGRKVGPLEALEEVASALESAGTPSRPAALLVAGAIRKCLNGNKPVDRDLLAAAGWQNRRGGRFETPAAKQKRRAQAEAAAKAMAVAHGATAKERAEYVARQLADSAGQAAQWAEELRLVGFGKTTSARAIQGHAKRAGNTSI